MDRRPCQRIFCLEESVWWDDLGLGSNTSVLPTLELLQRLDLVEFIHRHVAERAEFEHYLGVRSKRHADCGIIYLAFHGTSRGGLAIGSSDISILALADLLGPIPNAIVHLGSCSIFRDRDDDAWEFLKRTGARAITGYERDVDWVESAAFDQILLSYLAHYERVGSALHYFEKRHKGFADHMQWVCYDRNA